MRLIKKYPNRRLYDTKRGTYITLHDVKQLVIDQEPFKVIDVKSEKDLTQNTLLQIITEEQATQAPIFTTELLQHLIRFYHENSEDMVGEYLDKVMKVFLQQKDFYKKQWETYNNLSEPFIEQQLNLLQNILKAPLNVKKTKK